MNPSSSRTFVSSNPFPLFISSGFCKIAKINVIQFLTDSTKDTHCDVWRNTRSNSMTSFSIVCDGRWTKTEKFVIQRFFNFHQRNFLFSSFVRQPNWRSLSLTPSLEKLLFIIFGSTNQINDDGISFLHNDLINFSMNSKCL